MAAWVAMRLADDDSACKGRLGNAKLALAENTYEGPSEQESRKQAAL